MAIEKVESKPALPEKVKQLLEAVDRSHMLPEHEATELERLRPELEKLMSSIDNERDKALVIEHLPPIPPRPPTAPAEPSDNIPVLPERRRRFPPPDGREPSGASQPSRPSRARRRVRRRRVIGGIGFLPA